MQIILCTLKQFIIITMKQTQNNFLTVPTYSPTQPTMYKSGIFPKRQFYTPKSNLTTNNNQPANNLLNINGQQKKNQPLTPNIQKKSFQTNNFLNTLKNPQHKFNYNGTSKSMIFQSTNNPYAVKDNNNNQPKKTFNLLEKMARTVKEPHDDQHFNSAKNNNYPENKPNNYLEVSQKGKYLTKSPFSKAGQFKTSTSTYSPNSQNQKNLFQKKQFRPSMDPTQKQEDYNFKKPIVSRFKNFQSISPSNNVTHQFQKQVQIKQNPNSEQNNFQNSNTLNVPSAPGMTRQRSNTSNNNNGGLYRVHTEQSLNHPHHQTNNINGNYHHYHDNNKNIPVQENRIMSNLSTHSQKFDSSPVANNIQKFQKRSTNFNLLVPQNLSGNKIKTFSANKQEGKNQVNGIPMPTFLKFKPTPKKGQNQYSMQKKEPLSSKPYFGKTKSGYQVHESSPTNIHTQLIRPSQFALKMNPVQRVVKNWSMDDFQVKQRLGKGAFGDVYIARQNQSGFICVLKKLSKKKIKQNNLQEHVMRQIKIQSYLDHKNLTSLYGFFDDLDYIYLIIEFLTDGSLSQTKKKKKLPEHQASNILKQVCQGLKFMHNEQIIHRDLKPQNIFVHQDYMKIGDFGCAVFTNTKRNTVVGCLAYISPQQLNNDSYDDKIDVWSVGILTYELLTGKAPFQADIIKIARQQKQAKLSLIFDQSIQFSPQAKSFIGKLLEQVPQNRMTIKQALNHPFITKYKQQLDESLMMQTKSIRAP